VINLAPTGAEVDGRKGRDQSRPYGCRGRWVKFIMLQIYKGTSLIVYNKGMRNELLAWFAREGLLLTDVVTSANDPEHDEVKVTVKAPMLALSKADNDFRECPDPVLFGYPASALDMMLLEDMHQFVLKWYERAVAAGMVRCFVCNQQLHIDDEKPWDAVFVSEQFYCWLLVHFDCKRYLARELKGRNPFEVTATEPEFFDLCLPESATDTQQT